MSFDDVRMKGFSKNMKVQQAIELATTKFDLFQCEIRSLKDKPIQNYVLREDIYAKRSVPPFDRSAVDGFALKAEDTFSASETNPLLLKVLGTINIGYSTDLKVEKGTAIQVPTGGILPEGADAVIMVEDTNKLEDNYIEVTSVLHPRKNVSAKGEDVKQEQLMFQTGHKFRSVDRGFMLSAGITEVQVTKTPSIAIIVTGDELVEPWEDVPDGKIPETNSVNLFDLCKDERWKPTKVGIVKDEIDNLKKTIEKAVNEYDVVLINAGTSVGKKDFAPVILSELGDIVFHGLAMRPGGPVLCANVNNKIVFGIPGFPTATIIAFRFIIRPIISALMGLQEKGANRYVPATISRNVGSKIGRMDFLRVKLEKRIDGNYSAVPIQIGGSGILKNIVDADGFIIIPELSEGLKEGDKVEVQLW